MKVTPKEAAMEIRRLQVVSVPVGDQEAIGLRQGAVR
jgi:hypothetical protein